MDYCNDKLVDLKSPILSILVPAYNEEKTIAQVIDSLLDLDIAGGVEIIAIDDGSFDQTAIILDSYNGRISKIIHRMNGGKGSAIRAGLEYVHGKYTLIQDADLEYLAKDIPLLVNKAENENLPVVFGSRNLFGKHPHSSRLFYLGGLFVTWVTNFLYDTKITDEATGYKLIRTDVLKKLNLHSKGFELCSEITAKVISFGLDIAEVPISYQPRTRAQGKKIQVWDGVVAVSTLLYYKVQSLFKDPKFIKVSILVILAFFLSLTWSFTHHIEPKVDARAYNKIAINLLRGEGFRENLGLPLDHDIGILRAGPGYEFFLVFVYAVFGIHFEAVWIFQAFLHALSVVLLYLIAKRIFTKDEKGTVALISAAIYGLSPDLIEISAMVMTETLYLFLTILSIYLFIRLAENQRWIRFAVLLGLVLGFAFLVRPPLLLFLPIVLFYVLREKQWSAAVVMIACFGLVLLPWSVRNYRLYNQFVPTTMIGGDNLWLNNTIAGKGGQAQDYKDAPASAYVMEHGASTFPRVASEKFKNFVFENPKAYAKMLFYRILRYFSLIRPMGFWFYQSGIPQVLFVFSSFLYIIILFVLGFSGMWLAVIDKHRLYSYLVAFTITAPMAVIPIVVESRYRFQIYPLLALWSGYVVNKYYQSRLRTMFVVRRVFLVLLFLSLIDAYLFLDTIKAHVDTLFGN